MAKIIKFALEMKDGESARTIEDLRKHFDLEKVVAYLLNGRLSTWLRHRHLDAEADAVEGLSSEDVELAKKLCEILGVDYDEHQPTGEAIDTGALMENHERMNALRQFTSDPEILAKVDRVAFDEQDLRRLAFDNKPEVYLCNGRFVIPLNVMNKHFNGLGKVEAVIASETYIDFEEKQIQFTNVAFDEDYQRIAATETPEAWYKKGVEAKEKENYGEAMKWLKKAAESGHGNAMGEVGGLYYWGKGVPADYKTAFEWFEKGAESGDVASMVDTGNLYFIGQGVGQDYNKAIEWFKKAADKGNSDAMNRVGNMYYSGEGVTQDYGEAVKWYKKSADAGYDWGMYNLGNMYYNGKGMAQDYGRAMEWFKKAADKGNGDAMKLIGDMYYYARGVQPGFSN